MTSLTTTTKHDVIVVGAGPGGLAASMLLARAGLRVLVVERLPRVGGRTSKIEEDGFTFSLGPTFFNDPQILEGIFEEAGEKLSDHVELVRMNPSHRIHFGSTGASLTCAPSIVHMEAEIAKISHHDAANVRRYIEDNRKKYAAMMPVMAKAQTGWLDWLPVLRYAAMLRPWSTLETELRRYFDDPRVRRAFSFQSRYIGMSPYQAPSLFSILSYLEYEPGIFHPIGGCPSLCTAMETVARRLGVEFALGEEVQEVLFHGRKANGVRTKTGEHRAGALVINADFAKAMPRLVPNHLRRHWTDERIAKKRFSCSTFMMYLGIEGRYDDVHHHTVYLPDDYDQNVREMDVTHVPSQNPQFYVQNASVTDPTLAPVGTSTLSVMVPTTNLDSSFDWENGKAAYRALVIRELEKVGIVDLERRIRFEKIVTPRDWSERYEVYRGAVFSMAHDMGQMLHLRPQNRFRDLESVYLVGGGTHPGSGLPIIFQSAKITSKLLLEDLGVKTQTEAARAPLALAMGAR